MITDDIKEELFSDHKTILEKFYTLYKETIDNFISEFEKYFRIIDNFEIDLSNKKAVLVKAYLFNALNSLLSSTRLLLIGQLIPSGNLMRNYSESIAITLLSLSTKKNIMKRY